MKSIFKFLFPIFFLAAFAWLPLACKKNSFISQPSTQPTAVFNEAWKVMDQRYSFFTLKQVDWQQQYQQFKSQVNDQMSDAELFTVLSNLLQTVKDGHVSLVAGSDTSLYDGFYLPYHRNFNYFNIVDNYLTTSAVKIGPLSYHIRDSICYLYYSSFFNDITDNDLAQFLDSIAPTRGLIIDVRNNFGGNEFNVSKLSSRFIQNDATLYYSQSKNGPGHDDISEPRAHIVRPGPRAYMKPIVVLTNRVCYSATNDFVAFMQSLPHVITMGDQTGGGGGIPYSYVLANGWILRYSGSVTLSPDRVNIENGVQPDHAVQNSVLNELQGYDDIIDSAFTLLKKP